MITSGVATATTQVTLSSLFRTPAGPATLILANASSAGTIYVGAGTNVAATNGYPLVTASATPLTVPIPAGCPGNTWSCLASAATLSLAWIVTDPSGATGTGTLG